MGVLCASVDFCVICGVGWVLLMVSRIRLQQWDWQLFCAALLLALVSMIAMASAASSINPALAQRHAFWMIVGIAVSWAVAHVNYRLWAGGVEIAYGVSLALLTLVVPAGTMRLGATRWLSIFGLSFQPSELAKLTTIWLLARLLAGQPSPLPWRSVAASLVLALPPAILIFIQPDLGSSTIVGAIWLGMVWVAGAPRRIFMTVGAAGLALLPIAWHVLKEYQRARLLAFIDPHADPLGAGFSIIQSTIAIGSGQLWGRGWFAGTQNQLNFLPEHHSDFIFAVIGEEWGVVGALGVVLTFGWLLRRVLRIAAEAVDPQGRLLATGVFSWLAYQAVVNMGMVMGLLPVVGVPLPLISYGGSSLVMIWAAIGLLQSVHRIERIK